MPDRRHTPREIRRGQVYRIIKLDNPARHAVTGHTLPHIGDIVIVTQPSLGQRAQTAWMRDYRCCRFGARFQIEHLTPVQLCAWPGCAQIVETPQTKCCPRTCARACAPTGARLCNLQRNSRRLIRIDAARATQPSPAGTGGAPKWLWITNFNVTPKTVIALANDGGRLRWKIENEGFNSQKPEGYGLEHVYSQDVIAGKVFYLLLQIAHLLFQLTEKGSLFRKAFPAGVGSLRHLARRLLEAGRNVRLNPAELQELLACRVRICFNTSWPFCPSLIAVLSVLPRPVETPAVPPHCMTSLSVGRPSHALRAKALARAWPHSSRPVPALRRILQR